MGKARALLDVPGGAGSVGGIEVCATRLRTVVLHPSAVDDGALKGAGAFGVLRAGPVFQVIVGGEADGLAMDINDIIG